MSAEQNTRTALLKFVINFSPCESCEKWNYRNLLGIPCEWINSHQSERRKTFESFLKHSNEWNQKICKWVFCDTWNALRGSFEQSLALTQDKYRLWTRGKNYMLMAFTQKKRGWTGHWMEKEKNALCGSGFERGTNIITSRSEES
jgi:hypothetical protein